MYAVMAYRVLAVLSVRLDGWCIYVGAVPGQNYDGEWPDVANHGDKQSEAMAMAIAENLFSHVGIDRPYAH